jgi:hypothetical protein
VWLRLARTTTINMAENTSDNDWISRRWQGEGTVVANGPESRERRLPALSGEGGDPLMPTAGRHCAQCRQLDFLPAVCDCCTKTFCTECLPYDKHSCPMAQQKNKLAAVCPLCDIVVTTTPGQSADDAVERHISNGCKPAARKKSKHQCSFGKCKKSELIPCICKGCQHNFCLAHRATVRPSEPCPGCSSIFVAGGL